MQWIDEPDAQDQNLIHHALVLAADEPLAPAFVAFWDRLLSDGCAHAATSGWVSLSIDIAERQSADDEQGWLQAIFRNAQKRACGGVGRYYLRSDAFTCFDDGDDFDARQLRFLLAHYQSLKQAVQSAALQPLLLRINAIRPLTVDAATSNGWFDLQIARDAFGPLPAEDQALLAGEEPAATDPLTDLVGGDDVMVLLQELGDALIEYTPPTFEVIRCRITEGVEQGQRALFYAVTCPQFPDDGTDVVNDRVHRAATRLVQRMAPARGGFPGAVMRLELQQDGTWRHAFELMQAAA